MQDFPTKEHLRVLVADDDAIDRMAACRALQKSVLSVETTEAGTIAEALSALAGNSYDVALLDFHLPDGDGLMLLHEVRARGIDTPVVMLTGIHDELIAVELMKAGAADYIPKSKVTSENLARVLQNVRRLHRAQSQAQQADVARRESEARFRLVAASNIIGIVFWEADGTLTDANDAFLEMVGYPREAVGTGMLNWRQLTLPEYWDVDQEKIEELCLTGFCAPWEKELWRQDGSRVAILISASFLEPPDRKGLAFIVDITERKRAQDAQRFLSEASAALSSSIDYKETLVQVARLAVPSVADWCVIDLLEEGTLRRVALAHSDPVLEEKVRTFDARFSPDPNAPNGTAEVIRTFSSELVTDVSDTLLAANAHNGEHLQLLRSLEIRSYLCVPLAARGRILGTFTLVCGSSGRRYRPEDLLLAEEAAQRTALAIDNTRLLLETQARAERESVVNAIGQALRYSLDVDEILQVAVREVGQALNVSRCLWCWINLAHDTLTIAPQQFGMPGLSPQQGIYHLSAIAPENLAQWTGQEPMIVHDSASRSANGTHPGRGSMEFLQNAHIAYPVPLRSDAGGLFVVQHSGSARHWTIEEVALLRQVSALLAPALENAQLYAREHRVADMLQAAFLSNIPDQLSDLELATVYRAGLDESQVGGDCYDAFPLPDGRVGLVMADVSGKGLSAAVLTATVKYSLRAFAVEVAAPGLVLTRLNRMLSSDTTSMGEHFVTLFYAVFDPANGRLSYASAGHETQMIKRVGGGTTLLHANGPILGVAEYLFDPLEEHLNRGDSLILYTDGLTEARNPETRELLNVQRVMALVEGMDAQTGAGGLTARLEHQALEWSRGRPHDDMALLVARRHVLDCPPETWDDAAQTFPVPPEDVLFAEDEVGEGLFHLTFPCRASYAAEVRQAVAHWMETLQFDRSTSEDFLTAVTEAVANAVRYGTTGDGEDQFQVAAFRVPGSAMLVEIIDNGPGLRGYDPFLPMPSPDADGGRGMPLMREFADQVEYRPRARGLCVRLLKRRTA